MPEQALNVELRRAALFIDPAGAPAEVAAWLAEHAGQVFRLHGKDGWIRLHSLGAEADACRLPLNISSRAAGDLRLISNFAHTPFDLDGQAYASIEGFWQALKWPEEADRRRIAALHGAPAKDAGHGAPEADVILYQDNLVRVGTWEHWALMEAASYAKFSQNDRAREALLATGARPLTHEMKPDSKTIPGVILADIWMRLRRDFGGG